MGNIKILDKLLADMIAAGEVVERPASVVKELFENSKDAGAKHITVEIRDGGRSLIKITDDGCGMDKDDVSLSVVRHATSKISSRDDLFSIKTMGFRGEALASISAVSKLTIHTRKKDALSGISLKAEGGEITELTETGCPVGTTVTITDLFYNTPARLKFMKKDSSEGAYIEETTAKLILSNPDIAVRFIKDGRAVYNSPGDNDYKNAVYTIYGANIADNIIKVSGERNGIKIDGYVGNPNIAKPSRKLESFSVNGRLCKSKIFISGLENAYFQKISAGKYPFCFLNISVDYSACDVNVHPQKTEVKFSNEADIYDCIYSSVRNALDSELFVKNAEATQKNAPPVTAPPKFTPVTALEISFSEDKIKERTPVFYNDAKKDEKYDTDDRIINIGESKPVVFEFKTEDNEVSSLCVQNDTEDVILSDAPAEFKVVGQIFSSYIILEKADEMLLLDQHAACERINYEKIHNLYRDRQIVSQIIMSPKIIEMSASDYRLALDNSAAFSDVGITLEDFSDNTVIIRELPPNVRQNNVEKLIYEILSELKLSGKVNRENINLRLLFLVACKMSLKANMSLTLPEMEDLARQSFALEGKTTCPHGRPVFISFSKMFIENKFERT